MKIYLQQYSNFQNVVYFLFGLSVMSCNGTIKMHANTTACKNTKGASEESVLQSKLQHGIDFYAYGQNAEWELNLDFENDF